MRATMVSAVVVAGGQARRLVLVRLRHDAVACMGEKQAALRRVLLPAGGDGDGDVGDGFVLVQPMGRRWLNCPSRTSPKRCRPSWMH